MKKISIGANFSKFDTLCQQAKNEGWYYNSSWSMGHGIIEDEDSYKKGVMDTISNTPDAIIAIAIVQYNPQDDRVTNIKRIHIAINRKSLSLSKMLYYYFTNLREN